MVIRRRRERQDGESGGDWRPVGCVYSRRVRRASFLILSSWLFLSGSPRAQSQDADTVEYPVKLAFLYNFAKFVEWPDGSYHDAAAPLTICIVGDDPFSSDLEGELRTRNVGSHPVDIRTRNPNDSLNSCHIVFVPVSAKTHAARIVRGLQGSSTLTVGEFEGFAVRGGIINFTVEANRLGFEINPVNADRAGLKISSKLLNLAEIIRNEK